MIKVVINNCFGGFTLSDDICKKLAVENNCSTMDIRYEYVNNRDYKKRSDPKLVALVEEELRSEQDKKEENYEENEDDYDNEFDREFDSCYDDITDLVIVELPDETTDWTISEYDGVETVFYVVDGKIHRAYGDDDTEL